MAFASSVTIEELKGKDLKPNRVVELIGPALPFRGATWATKQRLTTTWYAGNGLNATQHVLGPMEMPSEWEGFWRTTRMVGAPSNFIGEDDIEQKITRAASMRDILEDIFLVGALLRVTWATAEGQKVVRLGRAEEWSFPTDRLDDIGWKVTFTWTGRGAKIQKVVTFRGDQRKAVSNEIATQLVQLRSEVEGINALSVQSNKNILKSANLITLGDLESFANAPLELLADIKQFANNVSNRVTRIGDLIANIATTPAQIAGSLDDVASTAAAALSQFSQTLGQTVPDAYTHDGSSRVTKVTKAASYFGSTQDQAEQAASAASRLQQSASRKASALKKGIGHKDRAAPADMIAVHVVKQGETFVSISKDFYKTPDHAPVIAKANGFPTFQISPPSGFPLIIPNLTAVENLNQI